MAQIGEEEDEEEEEEEEEEWERAFLMVSRSIHSETRGLRSLGGSTP